MDGRSAQWATRQHLRLKPLSYTLLMKNMILITRQLNNFPLKPHHTNAAIPRPPDLRQPSNQLLNTGQMRPLLIPGSKLLINSTEEEIRREEGTHLPQIVFFQSSC